MTTLAEMISTAKVDYEQADEKSSASPVTAYKLGVLHGLKAAAELESSDG